MCATFETFKVPSITYSVIARLEALRYRSFCSGGISLIRQQGLERRRKKMSRPPLSSRLNYIFRAIFPAFLVILLTITLGIRASVAGETLTFGTYSFEKASTTARKMRPILNALAAEMEKRSGNKVQIRLQIAKDYLTGINDLIEGRVDFARFGQAAYVIAKSAEKDLSILVVEGDHARKTFRSLIVVRNDSPIKQVTDLNETSFAFGDQYSTTGRYLPQAFLVQHGIRASSLNHRSYLKRHDQVAMAVANGKFDAGAISEWVYQDLISNGVKIRPIASFSSVTKPWVARQGLPVSMQKLIRESLIGLRGIKVLENIKKDCFLPGHDKDYDNVRQSITDNWQFFIEG